MRRWVTAASLTFLFFLFPSSSHNEELNTDFLFEGEPAGPMKRREVEKKKEERKIEGMVFIKGGCFDMGDTFGDGSSSEKPVHNVCVDDFYIGETEATQAKWKEVMGNNPSFFKGCDDCPVESVSFNDVQEFIKRLNEKSPLNPPFKKGGEGGFYRLPTEAEWEYAARSGGKKERYAGTNNESELGEYAWYTNNSGGKTHPVKQKRPNGLGLYDMSGNVWEWVSDRYGGDYYENSPKDNPKGPSSGKYRLLRGGSWDYGPRLVRVANRDGLEPDGRSNINGFRLALSHSAR